MTEGIVSTIGKIIVYQILIIIFVSSVFVVFGGWHKIVSPLLGGLAAAIPNAYFALRIYKASGRDARKIVNSFYAGESGKLLLTAALFIIIFQLPNIEILPLLTGYVTALSVFWFALLMR